MHPCGCQVCITDSDSMPVPSGEMRIRLAPDDMQHPINPGLVEAVRRPRRLDARVLLVQVRRDVVLLDEQQQRLLHLAWRQLRPPDDVGQRLQPL